MSDTALDWIRPRCPDADRQIFRAQIALKPTEIIFRGSTMTARKADPSQRRRMEIAGYVDDVADVEFFLALPTESEPPLPNSEADEVEHAGHTYRIVLTQNHAGRDCYIVTCARKNF